MPAARCPRNAAGARATRSDHLAGTQVGDVDYVSELPDDGAGSDDAYDAKPTELLRAMADALPADVRDGKIGRFQIAFCRREVLAPSGRKRSCWLEVRGQLPTRVRGGVVGALGKAAASRGLDVRATRGGMTWTA